jgi:hypothetical protein
MKNEKRKMKKEKGGEGGGKRGKEEKFREEIYKNISKKLNYIRNIYKKHI